MLARAIEANVPSYRTMGHRDHRGHRTVLQVHDAPYDPYASAPVRTREYVAVPHLSAASCRVRTATGTRARELHEASDIERSATSAMDRAGRTYRLAMAFPLMGRLRPL
jgi:hypothetical protein